jgi:hypothetical protein
MREAFPIVCALGDRFRKERMGLRDAKALVVLVAETGDWNGASSLADALGFSPDYQERIFREVYGTNPPPRSEAPPTEKEHHHEQQPSPDHRPRL